jgi:death-on-curing protein
VIRYISLPEFFWLAEQVTGIDAATLAQAGRTDLADSALRAGEAEFGGTGFYPGLAEKAAVLVCRLAWNHPLPDGNKRAAWASLIMFLDLERPAIDVTGGVDVAGVSLRVGARTPA